MPYCGFDDSFDDSCPYSLFSLEIAAPRSRRCGANPKAQSELAQRLNINRARIKQLEAARRGRPENMEVQSLARQAKALAYRVRMVKRAGERSRPHWDKGD
jgi:transcriptional regulator with XRE-family HTH domain